MAELQRVGGRLESHRRPGGRRVLLPAEAELCNAVGLTEDEYWHFVELTEAYNGERSEEYALIPDVRNDPVSLLVSLAIGVALSAVSALLAPKPQEPKKPPQVRTSDVNGRSKFAPQTGFDSVQELATLGMTVPLVFTRKGIRINGTLLWSQMLSLGAGQQFRGLIMFSSGEVESAPDFAGYAMGDTTLENYTNAKLALYFLTNGGRIREGKNRYKEGTIKDVPNNDAFSVFWDKSAKYEPYFSGARTPNTQTQFGCYAPCPNGMVHRPQFELNTVIGEGESKKTLNMRNRKARDKSPYRAAVVRRTGDFVRYQLHESQDDGTRYDPVGSEDIRQSQDQAREAADTSIAVGSQYLIGSALVVGYKIPPDPWVGGYTKNCMFKIIEEGKIDFRDVKDTKTTGESLTLQSVAIATVSNNRSCSATEIGIKSTVWGQITGFANVNSYPGDEKFKKIEKENGTFTFGSMTKYIRRLSFFTLHIRPLGSNAKWSNISDNTLFCIKGNTPQAQYNWIRINHEFGQWEFRLMPVAGNYAKRYFTNQYIYQLRSGRYLEYSDAGHLVAFEGRKIKLDILEMCNPEWMLGRPPELERAVREVTPTSTGVLPTTTIDETRADDNNNAEWDTSQIIYKWDGEIVGTLNSLYVQRGMEITVDGHTYATGAWFKDVYDDMSDDNATQPDAFRHEIIRKRTVTAPAVSTQVVKASGGSGRGLSFKVSVYSNGKKSWEIENPGKGYYDGESVYIPVANKNVRVTTDSVDIFTENRNKWDAISDYPTYDAERKSHMDGPEHEIVYVNEQLEQQAPNYENLAIAGLRMNSSKEWSNFGNLSAYFKRGVVVDRIYAGGRRATNLLPEIAYALLTDPVIGAGTLIGADQVDRARMAKAAKFCLANGFTWDGVVDQKLNLRQWIFENAGYCLLDFTIIGGRFSLVPSVPYKSSGQIDFLGKPDVKALFTDGNIRNMKVTFLSPEERQLFRASVLWRQEKENGFPETRTINIRLSDSQGGSDADPEEAFDMSGFCTSQEHALTFAKYALKLRKEVDHGVTFETTPQAAMNLIPGDHFRLVSEVTHTSRFQNGSVGPDGSITAVDPMNGRYQVLYWIPGTTGVRSGTLNVNDNVCIDAAFYGSVFTLNNTTTINRTYKCESLSYTEDGLVEVAGSFEPLTDRGYLKVLEWNESHFVVETG